MFANISSKAGLTLESRSKKHPDSSHPIAKENLFLTINRPLNLRYRLATKHNSIFLLIL